MAIAKLLKVEVVVPREHDSTLVAALEQSGQVHIEDIHEDMAEEFASIEEEVGLDLSDVDPDLQKAKWVLDLFHRFKPEDKGLLHGFFGSPPFVRDDDFSVVVDSEDLDVYEEALREKHHTYEEVLAQIERKTDTLVHVEPWVDAQLDLSLLGDTDLSSSVPVECTLAQVNNVRQLARESGSESDLAWVEVSAEKDRRHGVFVVLREGKAQFEAWLKAAGIEPASLPVVGKTPREIAGVLQSEIGQLRQQKAEIEHYFAQQADAKRRVVQALCDEITNRRKNLLVKKNMFYSRNVVVVTGWVKEHDRESFSESVLGRLPTAHMRFSQPTTDENPPVYLQNHALVRPFQLLIEMFGLPRYFGIDPTPFVAVTMTLFYAMCLGDAGYGMLQILLTLWLKRKFKPAEGTRLFLNQAQWPSTMWMAQNPQR